MLGLKNLPCKDRIQNYQEGKNVIIITAYDI